MNYIKSFKEFMYCRVCKEDMISRDGMCDKCIRNSKLDKLLKIETTHV
jgi:hypothetical protein